MEFADLFEKRIDRAYSFSSRKATSDSFSRLTANKLHLIIVLLKIKNQYVSF